MNAAGRAARRPRVDDPALLRAARRSRRRRSRRSPTSSGTTSTTSTGSPRRARPRTACRARPTRRSTRRPARSRSACRCSRPSCAIVRDDGTDADVGEVGEIVTRGPQVVPGYWNKPEETQNALRAPDGSVELKTGDVGYMDDQGWFYVVDRKKDQINAGGYKVWPREVEDVLYEHPAVREAAVVGVPDEYRGETVKAFVSVRPGQEVEPGRAHRVLQGADVGVQVPAPGRADRRDPQDRHRQAAPAGPAVLTFRSERPIGVLKGSAASTRTNSPFAPAPGPARRRHAESATIARDAPCARRRAARPRPGGVCRRAGGRARAEPRRGVPLGDDPAPRAGPRARGDGRGTGRLAGARGDGAAHRPRAGRGDRPDAGADARPGARAGGGRDDARDGRAGDARDVAVVARARPSSASGSTP